MTEQELQLLRFAVWPSIIGANGFFVTRMILILLGGGSLPGRRGALACLAAGMLAAVVTFVMTFEWKYDLVHWQWFTAGVCVIAAASVFTAARLFTRDWRNE